MAGFFYRGSNIFLREILFSQERKLARNISFLASLDRSRVIDRELFPFLFAGKTCSVPIKKLDIQVRFVYICAYVSPRPNQQFSSSAPPTPLRLAIQTREHTYINRGEGRETGSVGLKGERTNANTPPVCTTSCTTTQHFPSFLRVVKARAGN